MSFVTRCPVCETAFRVQREQLGARSGRVRCGKCGTVFDGIAGLVEETSEPVQVAIEPSPQFGLFDPGRIPASTGPAPAQERQAANRLEEASPEPAPKSAPEPEPEPAPLPEPALQPEPAPVPAFMAEPAGRPARSGWWAFLSLLALLVLAGQAAHRYRSELAVLLPASRPALEAGCEWLNCKVPLPRRPDLMSIESSDLQADVQRENLIQLNAVLKNRAPFPMAFPALELTLTDENDRAVVRRVLQPRDYLDAARAALLGQGIGAGGEAALRVQFDAGRSRATGYRLYLFYPP